MHSDQIGQHHGAYQALMVATQVLGIFHDGQRTGNALVARAAHNGDRQRAAVHTRIGASSRTCTSTAGDVVGASAQQRATHLGAPSVGQTLGADGAVQLNLTLNGSTGALNIATLDEVDDGLNAHGRIGFIGSALGNHALGAGSALPRRLSAHWNAVERMARHIGVVIGNLDNRGMTAGHGRHLDIQVGHTLDKRHIAVAGIGEQLGHAGTVRVIDALEHFERTLGVTAHSAQHRRCLNAVHTARVGNGYALDVLDDIARTGNVHMLGLAAERLTRQCRRISDSDGLGTAKRANKLAVQNVTERSIANGIGGHWCLLYTQRLISYT